MSLRDDPKKWVDSWLKVAYLWDLLLRPPYSWLPTTKALRPLQNDLWRNMITGGFPEQFKNRQILRKGYDLHVQNVQKAISDEQLLEFNVKQGWGPLCNFLDVPIPDTPFPRINDQHKVRGLMFCYELSTWFFMAWPLYLVALTTWVWKGKYRYQQKN